MFTTSSPGVIVDVEELMRLWVVEFDLETLPEASGGCNWLLCGDGCCCCCCCCLCSCCEDCWVGLNESPDLPCPPLACCWYPEDGDEGELLPPFPLDIYPDFIFC